MTQTYISLYIFTTQTQNGKSKAKKKKQTAIDDGKFTFNAVIIFQCLCRVHKTCFQMMAYYILCIHNVYICIVCGCVLSVPPSSTI